jgi:prepilin-type N-terminal cleavage/methylation domain-containing protein
VTERGGQRRARRGEQGLTLIELLVTIAVMGVGFLSMLAAFSSIERTVGATSDDAQLTAVARQVTDVIESESFAYVACTGPLGQAPTGSVSYQMAIRSAVTTSYTINILAVAQAQAAGSFHTLPGAAGNTPLSAINGCSTGPATSADFGVQQIQFQVATPHNSFTRIAYKRWN